MSSDYKVGYKLPPKATQFQKGQSGNPDGRPKSSGPLVLDVFKEEIERKITIKEDGISSKVTLLQAAIRQLTHKAAKGDMKAFKLCLELLKQIESLERIVSVPTMIFLPPDGPAPPEPPIHGE